MKNQNLFIIIIIAVIGVAGFFLLTKNKGGGQPTSTSGEKPFLNLGSKMTTAKQAYSIAFSEAKRFSPDSYTTNISSIRTQIDGRSRTWFVMFSSPAKNCNYKVNIVEGKVDQTDSSYKLKGNRVVDNWVDSDQVAKVALPKCGQTTESDYFFDLDTNRGEDKPEWSVSCIVGENKTLIVDVNARTGEFTKTRKAGIGW